MIYCFLPTRLYGGIDMTLGCLSKQKDVCNITWLVADELLNERDIMWQTITRLQHSTVVHVHAFKLNTKTPRNLASSYNYALTYARMKGDCELFVSVQDHMWFPDGGIARFLEMANQYPGALLTGVAHHAHPPWEVAHPKGDYTIWEKPHSERPPGPPWHWQDCRAQGRTGYSPVPTIEWEANYAAIPPSIVNSGALFDPIFDKAHGYENQDFAFRCRQELGANTIMDCDNVAICLPHRLYFPEAAEESLRMTPTNRAIVAERWNA